MAEELIFYKQIHNVQSILFSLDDSPFKLLILVAGVATSPSI